MAIPLLASSAAAGGIGAGGGLSIGSLSGVGSLVSGLLGSSSSKKAAKAQAAAAAEAAQVQREGLEFQKDIYADQVGRAQPWMDAGTDAVSYLRALLLGENDSRVGTAIQTPEMAQAQAELDDAQKAYDAALGSGGATVSDAERRRLERMADGLGMYAGKGMRAEREYAKKALAEMQGTGGGNQAAIDSALARLNAARAKLSSATSAAPTRQAMKADEALIKSPGYQFRLGEGEKGINRAAAAGGSRYSGATLKALQRYGQDFASNEFGNHVNRIFTLSGQGQTGVSQAGGASGTLANASQNAANNTGNAIMAGGNATAQGYLGSAGAINNAVQGGISNYLVSQYLSQNPVAQVR